MAAPAWRASRQVAAICDEGREVVVVSSGAIAVGSRDLGWDQPGRSIPEKQAAAAVGQIGLIELYRRRFSRRGRHVAQVLVTRTGLEERERDEQLGLAPGLEAHPASRSGLNDFFYEVALLVDLDRIHRAVMSGVFVLLHRALEGVAELRQAAFEDVREADQQRCAQVASLETADEIQQIDARSRRAARLHHDVSLRVHVEIAAAPARDVVELEAVPGRPTPHLWILCLDRLGCDRPIL